MSYKKRLKTIDRFPSDLRTTMREKRRIAGFVIIGIIQILFFISSFFIGQFLGKMRPYGSAFYPYSNRSISNSFLWSFGIMNAIYVGINKRISFQDVKKDIAIKTSISIGSFVLSSDIYEWGFNLGRLLRNNVLTVEVHYGVFIRREKA